MIRNKKLAPNAVLDDEGRQRFHGAFTGGFSAGHYNTVGSEEGFKPSTFTSSRSHRATRKEQSANDFVDAEDGLIGGVLSTKNVRLSPWLQSYFYANPRNYFFFSIISYPAETVVDSIQSLLLCRAQ
jgi:Protein of unknown function (DUF1604)